MGIHGEYHVNTSPGVRIRPSKKSEGYVCVTLCSFLKLYLSQTKKLSQFLLLRVNISS